MEELNAKKIKQILEEIIIEQAPCERSCQDWAEYMLKELDKAIPEQRSKHGRT